MTIRQNPGFNALVSKHLIAILSKNIRNFKSKMPSNPELEQAEESESGQKAHIYEARDGSEIQDFSHFKKNESQALEELIHGEDEREVSRVDALTINPNHFIKSMSFGDGRERSQTKYPPSNKKGRLTNPQHVIAGV